MRRCLLGLCFLVVVVPHLIPLPESSGGDRVAPVALADFKDDGQSLPTPAQMEKLAASDPVAFLEYCLRRHEREVTGYQLVLVKQERIDKNLEKKEVIDVWFKEQPHSAFMKWREGARRVSRALYVEGENQNGGKSMVVVKPTGIGGGLFKSLLIDPTSKNAKNSGRYPLSEFGLKKGLQRTLESWRKAKKDEALYVEYLGVKKVEELGGRSCHVLKRSRFKEPEGPDRVTEQVVYVDVETWLLVGSVLKNKDDQLVANYSFRDVQLNLKFAEDQFTKKRIEN